LQQVVARNAPGGCLADHYHFETARGLGLTVELRSKGSFVLSAGEIAPSCLEVVEMLLVLLTHVQQQQSV
jgi:hypothetical protein